jgi:hypothetical protein
LNVIHYQGQALFAIVGLEMSLEVPILHLQEQEKNLNPYNPGCFTCGFNVTLLIFF